MRFSLDDNDDDDNDEDDDNDDDDNDDDDDDDKDDGDEGCTFQYHLHQPTLYRFPMSRPPILPSEWRCNRNHLHHGFQKYHLYHVNIL